MAKIWTNKLVRLEMFLFNNGSNKWCFKLYQLIVNPISSTGNIQFMCFKISAQKNLFIPCIFANTSFIIIFFHTLYIFTSLKYGEFVDLFIAVYFASSPTSTLITGSMFKPASCCASTILMHT